MIILNNFYKPALKSNLDINSKKLDIYQKYKYFYEWNNGIFDKEEMKASNFNIGAALYNY